jgi:hypothetical protein
MMRWKREEAGGAGETGFGNIRLDVVEAPSEGFLTEGGIQAWAVCVTVPTWCECDEVYVRWVRGRTDRMCSAIDIKPSSTRTEV